MLSPRPGKQFVDLLITPLFGHLLPSAGRTKLRIAIFTLIDENFPDDTIFTPNIKSVEPGPANLSVYLLPLVRLIRETL